MNGIDVQCIRIESPVQKVFEFLADGATLPRWAIGSPSRLNLRRCRSSCVERGRVELNLGLGDAENISLPRQTRLMFWPPSIASPGHSLFSETRSRAESGHSSKTCRHVVGTAPFQSHRNDRQK